MNLFLIFIILSTIFFSNKGFSDFSFFKKYEFEIGKIQAGEYVRIISSGFLHVDVTHLAFNMVTLYFFSTVVCNYLGSFWFVFIYFSSLVLGNLLTLFFYKNEKTYKAVGASGAVTGVLYSSILLNPSMTLQIYFVLPIPAYLFGILYLFYSIYGMKAKFDNIGHSAHFGGAVAGFLITLCIEPNLFFAHTLMVVLIAIPIVILFFLQKKGKI